MLPGGRPRRLPGLPICARVSFEGLILAEIGNREAQGVDRDQFVGHVRLKGEDKVSGVQVAFQFAVIGGRVINQMEIDARAVGWRL